KSRRLMGERLFPRKLRVLVSYQMSILRSRRGRVLNITGFASSQETWYLCATIKTRTIGWHLSEISEIVQDSDCILSGWKSTSRFAFGDCVQQAFNRKLTLTLSMI
ncbi:hypothetical protein LTR06_011573, partial [Exophiala xenobiotica]